MSCALTRRDRTIMTTFTLIRGLVVIDRVAWQPVVTGVAGLAQIRTHRMGATLARGYSSIVTTLAAVAGLAVVNRGQWIPIVTGVTGFTCVGGNRVST